MRIEIAEHCFELRIAEAFLPILQAHYSLFASDKQPEITLDINVTENATTADGPWAECALCHNFMHFLDDHSIGWCDFARARAGLSVLPPNLLNSLGYVLRIICTVLVVRRFDGICLHGAAILHRGGAFIFVGPSGAGKSTIARLSGGKTVLSDERVFIKKRGSAYVVFPGPQGGDMQSGPRENKPYLIHGIFNLIQDKTVFIEPLKKASIAVAELLTIPDILFSLTSKEALLSTFTDLVDALPCYALHFLPEPSFWGHLESIGLRQSFGKGVLYEEDNTPQIGQSCLQDCR